MKIPQFVPQRLVYLATPYTHLRRIVRASRAKEAARIASVLANRGVLVFSPIAHGHAIDYMARPKPKYEYWTQLSYEMLDRCDQIYVAMMRGWYQSKGVQLEIAYAFTREIPILFLDPKDCSLHEQFIERRDHDDSSQFASDRREPLQQVGGSAALGYVHPLESQSVSGSNPEVCREVSGERRDTGLGKGEALYREVDGD